MASPGIQFFATREDVKEVTEIVEAQRPLTYVPAGLFDEPLVDGADSLLDIPDIGIARAGDAVGCPAYLVGPRSFVPAIRSVVQRRGETKYAIDHLENPQTVVISPGGVFDGSTVIAGALGTVSKSAASLELYRLFLAAFRRRFETIKSYRVGRNAAHLLDTGSRLTANIRSPALYDLTRG